MRRTGNVLDRRKHEIPFGTSHFLLGLCFFRSYALAESSEQAAEFSQPGHNGGALTATESVDEANWSDRLNGENLKRLWRVPLGPSYSGPIVFGDLVYTTETVDKKSEVVLGI